MIFYKQSIIKSQKREQINKGQNLNSGTPELIPQTTEN